MSTNNSEALKAEIEQLATEYPSANTERQNEIREHAQQKFNKFCSLPNVSEDAITYLKTRLDPMGISPDPHVTGSLSGVNTQQSTHVAGTMKGKAAFPTHTPVSGSPSDVSSQQSLNITLAQKASAAFQAALTQITEQGRYRDVERIKEGHVGTGFAATRTSDNQKIVIKLPASQKWIEDFDRCAEALRTEVKMLEQVNALLSAPDKQACARVITLIHHDTITVAEWDKEIPYSVQSFARGTPLWRSGLLPMRGDQERAGVLLLTQVIGMVQKLYEHNLAHMDLKHDALFWDQADELVEVIDWNSAREPTPADKEHEFSTALTNLVCQVFLGIDESATRDPNFGNSLFTEEHGRYLSRGVRLLLARLLDPHFSRNPIRDVPTLHVTLQNLAAAWLCTDETTLPLPQEKTPEALSNYLTMADIAVQQRDARAAYGIRLEWHRTAVQHAEEEVARTLHRWLQYPDNLRHGLTNIKNLYAWLPDIWPLPWVMPLIDTWFDTVTTEQHTVLVDLLHYSMQRKWDDLLGLLNQKIPQEPEIIKGPMKRLRKVAETYQQIPAVEALLNRNPPDYAEAQTKLEPLQKQLPLELRLTRLQERIHDGMQHLAEVRLLRERIADYRQREPSMSIQRDLLQALEELARVGYPDQDEAKQRDTVQLIKDAVSAYRQARIAQQNGNWAQVKEYLDRCQQDTLHAVAPDLATPLQELHAKAVAVIDQKQNYEQWQAMVEQTTELYKQVESLLQAGRLDGAISLVHERLNQASKHPAPPAEWNNLDETLCHVRELLYNTDTELTSDQIEAPPDASGCLPTLMRIIAEVRTIDQLRQSLRTSKVKPLSNQNPSSTGPNERAEVVWKQAQAALKKPDLPHVVRPAWQNLNDAASEKLQTALRDQITTGAPLTPEFNHIFTDLEQRLWQRVGLQDILRLRQENQLNQQLQEIKKVLTEIASQQQNLCTALKEIKTPQMEQRNSQSSSTLAETERHDKLLDSAPPAATQTSHELDHSASTGTQAGIQLGPTNGGTNAASNGWWNFPRVQYALVGLLAIMTVVIAIVAISRFGSWTNGNNQEEGFTDATSITTTTPEMATSPGSSETPSPAITRTPPPTDRAVSVSPETIDSLDTPLSITLDNQDGDSIELPADIALLINTERIPLPSPDSGNVTLPSTLLSSLQEPITLPVTARLDLGTGFSQPEVQLGGSDDNLGLLVTVRGAGDLANTEDNNLIVSDRTAPVGVVLWKTANDQERDKTNNEHIVRPGEATEDYVALKNDDQVRILSVENNHYFVRVVTNKADADNPNVVGKEGWVRRDFIDGPPLPAAEALPSEITPESTP